MRILRHTKFANGHVEYEALEDEPVGGRSNRAHILAIFEDGESTEVTIIKANGTVSTYTKVEDLVHGRYTIPDTACGHEWEDGWGSGHRCNKRSGHPTDFHRCPCDANTRRAP